MKLSILFITVFIQNSIIVATHNSTESTSETKDLVLSKLINDYDRKVLKHREAFIFYQNEFDKISHQFEIFMNQYVSKVTRKQVKDGVKVRRIYEHPDCIKISQSPLLSNRALVITFSRQLKFPLFRPETKVRNKMDLIFGAGDIWAARIIAGDTDIVLPMSGSDSLEKGTLKLAVTTLFMSSVQTANIGDQMKFVELDTTKSQTSWPIMIVVLCYTVFAFGLTIAFICRKSETKKDRAEEKSSMLKPLANGLDDDFDIEFVDE